MAEKLYAATTKGGIYNYFSTILVTVFQFVTSIVLVRLLTVSDYGIYHIIMGGLGVLGLVFPVATILRFLPEYFQEKNYYLAQKLVKIFLFYSIIALSIFAL